MHTDETKLLCDKCPFTTKYKASMDSHMKECTMHLKCRQCDFVCSSTHSLKSHVKNEHMVLRCKEEGCSFATKSALLMDNHMVDTHQKAVKVSHRGLSLPKGFL